MIFNDRSTWALLRHALATVYFYRAVAAYIASLLVIFSIYIAFG